MKPMRILIVEDEPLVARTTARQVAALGYEPIGTTARGDEAVALTGELRPDLVLMDIQIDGPIDGIAAARTVREQFEIPVVFLTASVSDAMLERAKTVGPFGYIIKPFEERELRMVIEVALNLHRTETRFRHSEAGARLLSRAVEQSPVSIVVTNAEGRIEYVNPHFTAVTGYTAGEAVGQNPRILKSGRQPPDFYQQLWATISSGREWSGEFHNRRKDGSLFWEHASVSPVRDDDGRITHYVAVKEDITERKASEERLLRAKAELQETNAQLEVSIAQARELAKVAEAANSTKSAFLATMSHELRTPLNVINGVSATLLEQAPPEEQRIALNLISQSGQNLLGIIEEILDYTRLQAGQATLDPQPCDLAVVVFHALRLAAERASHKGIDVRCHISPDVPARAVADARKLRQVLVNLLSNAVKFTEWGYVELRLDARRTGDGAWMLEFAVHDTGIGIEPAALARLFLPFSQADDSITRRFGGSGLGLAISRSLAQLMGGDIIVESQPKAGSVFRLTIQAGTSGESESFLAAGRHPHLQGRRALIAVAQPSHGSYLESMLVNWGLECGLVDHGTVLPGAHGPGGAFDVILIEAEVLPPGLRTRWDRLHVGPESPPVIWIAREPGVVAEPSTNRSRTLAWPVAPDELQRALADLLGPRPGSAPPAETRKVKLGQRLPLRILAADDVRTNREVLRIIFRHLDYQPDFAENGAEVLEALGRKSYDLVLLDVQMPVMDGLTAAREIRKRYPHDESRPRLVAITANALPGAREECLAAGMDEYLSKPVVPKQLEECFLRLFPRHEPAPPAPTAAPADSSAATEEPAWVDPDHIAAIASGSLTQETQGLITQLVESLEGDFHALMPRVRQACAARDRRAAGELIHGLKGGALTLGWLRLAALCAHTLAALHNGEFTDWDHLPSRLEGLFTHSRQATHALLARVVHQPIVHPGTSTVPAHHV